MNYYECGRDVLVYWPDEDEGISYGHRLLTYDQTPVSDIMEPEGELLTLCQTLDGRLMWVPEHRISGGVHGGRETQEHATGGRAGLP